MRTSAAVFNRALKSNCVGQLAAIGASTLFLALLAGMLALSACISTESPRAFFSSQLKSVSVHPERAFSWARKRHDTRPQPPGSKLPYVRSPSQVVAGVGGRPGTGGRRPANGGAESRAGLVLLKRHGPVTPVSMVRAGTNGGPCSDTQRTPEPKAVLLIVSRFFTP
jgi:hypothetical protein